MVRKLAAPFALASALAACGSAASGRDGGHGDSGPTCASRTDCPLGEVCAAGDGGALRCGGCLANADCRIVELCGANGRCGFRQGFGDQCVHNADCSAGQFCLQGLCQAQAQVTLCQRGHCPAGERCNIPNQVCELDLGCQSDGDCLATQVCNLGTLACEPRCDPANPGMVCAPSQQCMMDRCVDCTRDADCGTGLTCNAVAGRCIAANDCFSDQACAAGKVCDLASHTCGPKPAPCSSNDGCAKDQVCDVTTGSCVAVACQADAFDPNQSQATAAPIVVGNAYANLTLCGPQDQDWFSLSLLSGDELQVTITTEVTGAGYSFDVQLRDDAGAVLADGKNLSLNGTVPRDGTYFLEVTDGDPEATYGLSTLVSHGVACPGDRFDPNQDAAHAPTIDGGIGPIYLCAGQVDWFAVAIPPAGLAVTLGCDPTQGPLAIAALNADGGLVASNAAALSSETVAFPAGSGPRGFVTVTGDGQDNNAYTLGLVVLSGPPDSGIGDGGADGGHLAH